MRKIPTVFVRDWDGDPRYVTRAPDASCGWVFAGEGRATRKYDGTCVRFDGERWWARREVRPGRSAPEGFVPVSADGGTGRTVGWEPAERSAFWRHLRPVVGGGVWEPGTYELVGPKVNGNPEGFGEPALVRHGADDLGDVPLDFDGLAAWLHAHPYEGIVWHGPEGRMAKLKRRDFPAPGGARPRHEV
ncbi:DUF5565 family protein [Spirillospora albida]|uniref:RNA ligase 1 family protein n=1 Tax=Spirillospora albida TaxID=58123 RepID=UPI0004BEE932|nr:DUF5565 family protein [Spirillospora albida]